MIHVSGYHEYIGGVIRTSKGYHEYNWGVFRTSKGYHEYIGGYQDLCGGAD